jgi:Zn-finger nucleic acid-binding protein
MTSHGVTVDACQQGCAGVWFDLLELQRFDESHEPEPASILQLKKRANIEIDLVRKRCCPKCAGIFMTRRLFRRGSAVHIDECPGCGGIWLDAGELEAIRKEPRPIPVADKKSREHVTGLVYRYLCLIKITGLGATKSGRTDGPSQ